jgi:hypothetical protein
MEVVARVAHAQQGGGCGSPTGIGVTSWKISDRELIEMRHVEGRG